MKMKKLFIVFEGIDGVGKSTLAEKIAEKFKVGLTHNDKSRSYEEGKENSYKYIETLREMPVSVIDRLVHTGETVYAPLYRGYDGIDYFEDLEEKMIEEFNILIVYVTADEEIVKSRLSSRGEDYINAEDLAKLKERYDEYLSLTKFPTMIFDNSRNEIVKNVNELALLIAANVNEYFNK